MSDPFLSPATTGSSESDGGFNLEKVVGTVRKRLWMILGIIVTIPALVGFVVSKQPKIYEGSSSIVIDLSAPQYLGTQFQDVVNIESSWWTARETLETEFRIIRSASTAKAVARALCSKHVGPDRKIALKLLLPDVDCDKESDMMRAVPSVMDVMDVAPVKDARIVWINTRHTVPEMAAVLSNTIAQTYVDRNLERRLAASEGAATWLGDEYGDLSIQVNQAEHALIDFKRKNGIISIDIDNVQNNLAARRTTLASKLNEAEIKLIGLRAQRDTYEKLRVTDPTTDFSPVSAETPNPAMVILRGALAQQRSRLLELRSKYLPNHPTYVAQESLVDAVKEDMIREVDNARKYASASIDALTKTANDLRAALNQATQDALELEQKASEFRRLKRDYDRLTKLSDQIGGRERETSLATHLKTNNARILDPAIIPTVPISPNVPRSIAVALSIAIVLSLGLAFLLEFLDTSVKTQEDVERTVGVPFLGLIPTIDPTAPGTVDPNTPVALTSLIAAGSRDLYALAHPKSSLAECCRAIRTNLLFMSPDKPIRTLLVTSAGPQEGKTTSAVNLAVTLAQSGLKVLLVDTDMRRPRLHKAFGIPVTPDGLSKAIVGEAGLGDVVRETGVPNLYLLPCGATPPNPAELLHAESFRRIVEEAMARYDRVIFDSPPIGAVTDAAILARLTHGTVLVAKAGRTRKDALARARMQLVAGGDDSVNILGCILNDLDLNRQGRYGYYYSKYGYYYREENAPVPTSGDAAQGKA